MSVKGFLNNGVVEKYDYGSLDNIEVVRQDVSDSAFIDFANEYSNTKRYSIGDYAFHDGVLYRCIVDIPIAENWIEEHWTQVTLGKNVNEIESSLYYYERLLNDGKYTIQQSDLQSGTWAETVPREKVSNDARARVRSLIPVHPGTVIEYNNTTYDSICIVYPAKGTTPAYLETSSWVNGNGMYEVSYDGSMGIAFRDHSDPLATVDFTNVDSVITIHTVLADDVHDIEGGAFFDERLLNDDEYTIQLSDLESGTWSDTTGRKVGNNARARVKNLVPVHPGMTVEYENTTYDTCLIVFPERYTVPYIEATEWTNGNGTYKIEHDGLMSIMYRNHSDPSATVDYNNIDSVITIRIAAGYKNDQRDSAIRYISALGKIPDEIKASNLFEGAQHDAPRTNSLGMKLTKIKHGVHIKGTLAYSSIAYIAQTTITLKANTTYTLYVESELNNSNLVFYVSPGSLVSVRLNNIKTFTTDSEKTNRTVSIYQDAAQDGIELDNDFHVYLVEGTYSINEMERNDAKSFTAIENLVLPENIVKKNLISAVDGSVHYTSDYAIAYVRCITPGTMYSFISEGIEGQSASGLYCGIHTFNKNGEWIERAESIAAGAGRLVNIKFSDNVYSIAITYPFTVATVSMYGRVAVDEIARQRIKNLQEITKPTVSMKKNSPLLISEIVGVAETYYEHRNDKVNGEYTMRYGNDTVLGNNFDGYSIDCSAFIGLVYRGIHYEDTAYGKTGVINDPESYVANPDYAWSVNLYEYKEYAEEPSLVKRHVRTAAQIAEFMVNRGYSVISMEDDYVNVEPGDIVFWAAYTEPDGYKNEYMYQHISHVALCISKTKNPAGSTYPFSHQVIHVVHENPCVKKTELETTWTNQLVLVVRPDLGSIGYDGTKLTLGNTTLNEEQLIALLSLIS